MICPSTREWMMNKIDTCVFDVDGVLFKSIETICNIYTLRYHDHPDYIEPIPEQCTDWEMRNILPLLKEGEMEEMFASDDFFDMVVINKDMQSLIHRIHNDGYRVIFCSVGNVKNTRKKLKVLSKLFPYASYLPIVSEWDYPKWMKVDKIMINMHGCAFVDDSSSNLHMSNASVKILFNEYGRFDCSWNKDWVGLKSSDVRSLMDTIYWAFNKEA